MTEYAKAQTHMGDTFATGNKRIAKSDPTIHRIKFGSSALHRFQRGLLYATLNSR